MPVLREGWLLVSQSLASSAAVCRPTASTVQILRPPQASWVCILNPVSRWCTCTSWFGECPREFPARTGSCGWEHAQRVRILPGVRSFRWYSQRGWLLPEHYSFLPPWGLWLCACLLPGYNSWAKTGRRDPICFLGKGCFSRTVPLRLQASVEAIPADLAHC